MNKLVCAQRLKTDSLQRIIDMVPGWEVICGHEPDIWLPHVKEAEVILGWRKEMEPIFAAGNSQAKWLQTWGAGVDNMPLAELHHNGVAVTNASGVHPIPIAESVFAMLLSFTRKLHCAVRSQLAGEWQYIRDVSELYGQTIGIIGVGAIGERIAQLARAFGMRVLGVRRSGEPSGYVDRMFAADGLQHVLTESDFVVVTLPATSETSHMFGAQQFAAMKSTACFINIGRGQTTDTDALVAALQSGGIAGAGLDVFEQEPLPAGHPLWTLDNVIITPHNSGLTNRYEDRVLDIFTDNLASYLQTGKPRRNIVDAAAQY